MADSLSEKMLTQQLRELEADRLITRTAYNQVPPKVEYSLTEIGRSLVPVMQDISSWSQDYQELEHKTTFTK